MSYRLQEILWTKNRKNKVIKEVFLFWAGLWLSSVCTSIIVNWVNAKNRHLQETKSPSKKKVAMSEAGPAPAFGVATDSATVTVKNELLGWAMLGPNPQIVDAMAGEFDQLRPGAAFAGCRRGVWCCIIEVCFGGVHQQARQQGEAWLKAAAQFGWPKSS